MTYTEDQRHALDIIRSAKKILANGETHDLRIAAKIDEIQRKYPRASEVHTAIKNGEPHIVCADSKITEITGFTPSELKDKPVSFIMFEPFEPKLVRQMVAELEEDGMCVKLNNNRHKDGHLVKTFGWIFKISDNTYREFVMKASHVVGYGTK